jgi:uridine kinase
MTFSADGSFYLLTERFTGLSGSGKTTLCRMLAEALPRPIRLRDLFYRSKDSVQMQPAERRAVVEYYREDILKLENFYKRNLSAWRS